MKPEDSIVSRIYIDNEGRVVVTDLWEDLWDELQDHFSVEDEEENS